MINPDKARAGADRLAADVAGFFASERERIIREMESEGEVYGRTFGVVDSADGLRVVWRDDDE